MKEEALQIWLKLLIAFVVIGMLFLLFVFKDNLLPSSQSLRRDSTQVVSLY